MNVFLKRVTSGMKQTLSFNKAHQKKSTASIWDLVKVLQAHRVYVTQLHKVRGVRQDKDHQTRVKDRFCDSVTLLTTL